MSNSGAHLRLTLWPRILLVVIVLLTALRPGDAAWVNDEPLMMEMAIRYNHTGSGIYGFNLPFTPCPFGLEGTRGTRYGPLPIWLDQVFLAFTNNLTLMVAVHAILFSSMTAVGLNWLARTLRLTPWFAIMTMLSPCIWLYGRSLWDSTWCIPISALLLGAYGRFLATPKPAALILAVICCFVLPLVHLMGIALALPVLLHILIFHRSEIWAWKWKIGLAIALCVYLFWPYLFFFFTHFRPSVPADQSALRGWFFPLFGGTFQTLNVEGTLPDWRNYASPILTHLIEIAQWISRGVHLIVWLGMAVALPRAWSVIRRPQSATVIDHLCLLALSVWLCQSILDGLGRVFATWHYYSGTWCVYAFLAWMAVDWLRLHIPKRIVLSMLGVYAASLLLGIAFMGAAIARNAGARKVNFGTTLGNQIAAVKELRRYSDDSSIDIQLPQWKLYPYALKVLMALNPPSSGPRPLSRLIVKYRDACPGDAHIEVVVH